MNDVKEICDLALDVPAPPLPAASETIVVARRAARRRHAAALGGTGLLLVAVAAALVSRPAPVAPAAPAAAPVASSSTPAPVPTLSRATPSEAASKIRGDTVSAILKAATPVGYTATRLYAGDNTWRMVKPYGPGYAILTGLAISAGGRQGELQTFLYSDGRPAPTGDLCSAAVTAEMVARVNDPADSPCEMITINGVSVRVTTDQDPDLGLVKTATRFLQGGILQVIAQQAAPNYTTTGPLPPDAAKATSAKRTASKPGLLVLPFSSQQVAVLAVNPALLP